MAARAIEAHNPSMTPQELAQSICVRLRESGHQAYLVGGCVRDLLLKREPADYDVATDARPERVQELFPDSIAVGAQFGVIIVVEDSAQVEVATFRSDIGYADGRHPLRVEYSDTPEEDVRRRDFTVNGMMMDPQDGRVLDFVEGQKDLRAGVIRAIGEPEKRFAEDKLRMVRAVRFSARFGYAIEPATMQAIVNCATEVSQVSQERLRDELTKLLTEGAARRAFELLDETGLLRQLLPEISKMKGVAQPPQFHPEGDVWVHTLLMLEGLPAGTSPTLAWGVLLHDVGKPPTFKPPSGPSDRIRFDEHVEVGTVMAERICQRFRFSNDDTEQIASLVANHLRFKDAPQMKQSTLKRFVRLPRFEEHLELHRLDCLSSHRNLENYEYVKRFLAETPAEVVRPQRLISGEDLKELGFRPGPVFREILQVVEDAQLEGRIASREAALALVRGQFEPSKPA
ncbi:MAG TPA: CCA tRNA nucleotidyltransferase [Candidatus Acidoferrales bacterium]|nr:CCA tRNA nucleotidyltransferase [Candidatus Acidoferrales bacterium]